MEKHTQNLPQYCAALRGRTKSQIRLALLVNRAVKVEKQPAQPIDHMRGIEKASGVPLFPDDLRAGVDSLLQNPYVPGHDGCDVLVSELVAHQSRR